MSMIGGNGDSGDGDFRVCKNDARSCELPLSIETVIV